jgi:hypothetical protein
LTFWPIEPWLTCEPSINRRSSSNNIKETTSDVLRRPGLFTCLLEMQAVGNVAVLIHGLVVNRQSPYGMAQLIPEEHGWTRHLPDLLTEKSVDREVKRAFSTWRKTEGFMVTFDFYVWMGTGGTCTPLHFDSYDNLFMQLVGAKYVRLYPRDATLKLYVSTSGAYGLQGIMNDLDCEREDWAVHGKARDAEYTEVLLLPGDALLISARTWQYVRALSTSLSVNNWF